MAKFHIRRGDEVVVLSGEGRGRRGKITQVLTDRASVLLEATDERASDQNDRRRLIRPTLHHLRKSAQNPNGKLLWLEGPIHISKVMKVEEHDRRQAKKSKS